MKYTIIIATTLIVAAKSVTNITCNTTADCLADEWCFDKECYPGCNIDGGVDCEWEIGFNFVCNENTGECYEPNCNNTAGFCEAELPGVVGVKCVDYSFGDFGCEASPCNVTDDGTMYCPDPYVCDEWEDYCVESCVVNNFCGPEESYCNVTTGLCQQEYCFSSDCPSADTYCWDGWVCLDYCSDTLECPSNYICDIPIGSISGTCIMEDCNNSPDPNYCLNTAGEERPQCTQSEFFPDDYYCDASSCISDQNCTDSLGDGYVCNLFDNVCIAECTDDAYCKDVFDTDITTCNLMTGNCQFPCVNDTGCASLNGTFTCNNVTSQCEPVPECVADPTLCPLQSMLAGFELVCNGVNGECEPVWCSNTDALGLYCSADSSICVEEEGYPIGFCYIPCMSDTDCLSRIAAVFEPGNWTCGEFGNCYVPNITTEAPMMTTTMDMSDGDGDDMMTTDPADIATTDDHDDHDHGTDGVQGYGIMMVLGVIVVMISFM